MRTAALQVADTGPLESLVVMLKSAGYRCRLLTHRLQAELRSFGCDTVLAVDDLVRSGSYDRPMELEETDDLNVDLYVDVKAHRNGPKVWERYPHLRYRTLWYRINGGKPEIVPGCGDEINPPCPVLTPNQWYALDYEPGQCVEGTHENLVKTPWYNAKRYACWPPFVRAYKYEDARNPFTPPICLVHNLQGLGYGKLLEPMRKLGIKVYGAGSPDGILKHSEVSKALSTALAYVHVKSVDAPGYALYEAMAAGCPVVCTRRLIWRCRMQELLEPGKTCYVFDRETHDPLTDADVAACVEEVAAHLHTLKTGQSIGEAGRARLKSLLWTNDGSFNKWMTQCFG